MWPQVSETCLWNTSIKHTRRRLYFLNTGRQCIEGILPFIDHNHWIPGRSIQHHWISRSVYCYSRRHSQRKRIPACDLVDALLGQLRKGAHPLHCSVESQLIVVNGCSESVGYSAERDPLVLANCGLLFLVFRSVLIQCCNFQTCKCKEYSEPRGLTPVGFGWPNCYDCYQ